MTWQQALIGLQWTELSLDGAEAKMIKEQNLNISRQGYFPKLTWLIIIIIIIFTISLVKWIEAHPHQNTLALSVYYF